MKNALRKSEIKIFSKREKYFFVIALVSVLVVSQFSLAAHADTTIDVHELVARTNRDRVAGGLQSVTEDARLSVAAQNKADDMALKGYFSHRSPNGSTPWTWIRAQRYFYIRAGENLALNFDDAESVEQAWMQSPSHRANVMGKSYTRVGIGISHGTYNGKKAVFVVQFFATPYVPKGSRALVF